MCQVVNQPDMVHAFLEPCWPWSVYLHVCAQSLSRVRLFAAAVDCSPPGFSVHGIFQTRIREWVAISSSRRSSRPRDWTCVSCIGRWILYHWSHLGSPFVYLGCILVKSIDPEIIPLASEPCSLATGQWANRWIFLRLSFPSVKW